MSVFGNGKREAAVESTGQMPAVTKLRGAPAPRARAQEREYADEAARAAQRYLDQVDQIASLTSEIDHWRSRAMVSEAEAARLLEREAQLIRDNDAAKEQHLEERQAMDQTLAVLQSQFATASTIILDAFKKIDELKANKPKVSMPLMAAAVDLHADHPHDVVQPDDRMPSVVMKGPAYGSGTDSERRTD